LEDFVALDASIEEYVLTILKPADYMRFRHMACWLRTDFNIVLSKNNRPHSLRSLSDAFGISVDEITRLIRRLEAKGLAVWSIYPDSGHDGKILMFNPHYIRKRKQVNKNWLTLFTDFKNVDRPVTPSKKKAAKKQAATKVE
jgi:biotin operon repressor